VYLFIEQNVVQVEISMNNVVLVQVRNSFQQRECNLLQLSFFVYSVIGVSIKYDYSDLTL
jgi:hypothetical protein